MRIDRFTYRNSTLEWELEPVAFSDLTLLVGVSGAGKIKILDAVRRQTYRHGRGRLLPPPATCIRADVCSEPAAGDIR